MQDPLLHRQLGPYLIERVVGRGGMGTVYAAKNVVDGQVAAIKVLSPVLATDSSFRERFVAEIESLKKLRHPHIVQLYGFGEQDGQLFYAMELMDGNSLQEELRRGRRFTWREVCQISIDICGALKHAHDHGVIHRDLKPANLLYTPDEKVRLLDFGIAKLFGATGVTTGSVMGTADYMSPEQAEGKTVGPRSDLYSLGSVMYALLAGRPPFVGKSVPEVVHKVRFEPPVPVSRLAPDVPLELESFIEQLLEKNPQKRVPTALAAIHRLKAMLHALSIRQEDASEAQEFDTSVDEARESQPTSHGSLSSFPTVRMGAGAASHEDADQLTIDTNQDIVETGPDHFTVVGAEGPNTSTTSFSWESVAKTVLTIFGAVLAIGLLRYVTRPPSADELYAQVKDLERNGTSQSLLRAEPPIDQFLRLHADDSRAEELRQLQQAIQLERLQRRLESRAERGERGDSPLEQVYMDLLSQSHGSPEVTIEKLQAFLDLYTQAPTPSDETRKYLELARQHIARLRTQTEQRRLAHFQILDDQLQIAKDLMAREPEKARKMLEAVIRLYQDQPWAAESVANAQELLQEPASAASAPPTMLGD